MSQDQPKITTVKKAKDPRRVEAGKRLAAISKEARERKMREKIESENKHKEDETWNINYGALFGVLGVTAAFGALYYARRADKREVKKLETIKEEPEPEHEHVVIRKEGSRDDEKKCGLDSL